MKTLCCWLLMFFTLSIAVPAAAAGLEEAGDEAETLILRKLAEDGAYFKWILAERDAGRKGDLDDATFAKEVRRAETLGPVLDYVIDTARSKPNGERIDLGKVRKKAPTTYTQLATYLNLIGTVRAKDFIRAQELAESIDLETGFGPTQSIEGYRVALTRHYYFLNAVALYHLEEDADAVQWFGQIDADAEVKDMNLPRKREIESLRLADLSERPIAVTGFAAQDKGDEEHAWLGLAVADGVTNDLVKFTEMKVVERTRLESIMGELSLGLMGVVNEEHAVKVGQMLEAGTLVYGSYHVDDDVVTLQGRLVHVESGAVLQSAIVKGNIDHIFETTRELTSELLGDAGLVTAVQKMRIAGARAPSGKTVRAVAQARLMAASKPDAARELFEEAMRNDPEYANAHEALRLQFADVTAKVAVLPLRNTTGKAEDAWLSDGLAELLGRDLPVLGFSTVERAELRKMMTYQLAIMGAADAADGTAIMSESSADLAALGEQVAANFLMLGGFQHLNDEIKITVRFVDVGSGEVLYTAGAEGPMKDYGKVVAEVVANLAGFVNRDLDAETLAALVEGKPSLEEFERFMRGELAKDALTADDARSEGEEARLAEDQAARDRMKAVLQERYAAASKGVRTRRTIAATTGLTGIGMAAVGLYVGAGDRQKAGEFLALAEHSIRQEDADANLDESIAYHRRASTWQAVGGVGVGLAVVSTGVMVFGNKVNPNLDGIELAQGQSMPEFQFALAPTVGGAMAHVDVRW